MNRFYIMVGDPTTVGGHVATGLDSMTWHGKATAWEGDKIECPAGDSIGIVQCGGTRISSTNGHKKEQALNGDLCICKCVPPPRLIATQTNYGTRGEFEVEVLGASAEHGYLIKDVSSIDEKICAVDEKTGKALSGLAYFLKSDGGLTKSGYTDDFGMCERVYTKSAEKITVWFGASAIGMMNEVRHVK